MSPEAKERFLSHILGAGVVAEHTGGKGDHPSKVSLEQLMESLTVTRARPEQEGLIRVFQNSLIQSLARRIESHGLVC
jgi:hypothetical protein